MLRPCSFVRGLQGHYFHANGNNEGYSRWSIPRSVVIAPEEEPIAEDSRGERPFPGDLPLLIGERVPALLAYLSPADTDGTGGLRQRKSLRVEPLDRDLLQGDEKVGQLAPRFRYLRGPTPPPPRLRAMPIS